MARKKEKPKRRGLGSIAEKNGKWYYIIEVDPVNGKRKQKWVGKWDSPKEAELALAKAITEREKGVFSDSNQTLRQYAEYWMENYVNKNLSERTKVRYKGILDLRIIPLLGHIKLNKLKPMDIRKFYNKIIDNGRLDNRPGVLSVDSLDYHRCVLKSMLNFAIQDEIIFTNPAKGVPLPISNDIVLIEKRKKIQYFTPEQVEILLNNLEGKKYYTEVYVAIYTGFRRGELLALKWDDINWDNKTIRVDESLAYSKEKQVFTKPPKNEKSYRIIKVSQRVIEVLKTYEIKQKELLLHFGNKIGKKDFIFCQYDRQPPFPDSISTWFPKYLQKIELTKISFHCLRHTHASLLLMAGASLKEVSERLGHSSYVITADRYSHLLPQQEQSMVDKLDAVLLN